MKHSIKMIAMDVDGTLVNEKRDITPETYQALLNAQAQGIILVIASGRPTTGLIDFARQLKMHENKGYIVSYNGSSILNCQTNEILFNQPLEAHEIKEIIQHLKPFDVYPMVDDGKTLYVDDSETYKLDYEVEGSKYQLSIVDNLYEHIDFTSNKVLVSGQPEILQQHFDAMRAPFTDRLSIAFSAPFYVEFTAQGVDKGNALEILATQLGLSADQVMAFGDGGNDLSMIQYAGLGIAMENATPALKEAAKYITSSNEDEGIAKALHHYLDL